MDSSLLRKELKVSHRSFVSSTVLVPGMYIASVQGELFDTDGAGGVELFLEVRDEFVGCLGSEARVK